MARSHEVSDAHLGGQQAGRSVAVGPVAVAADADRLGRAAPADPQTGQPGVRTHAIITAILQNPKYLGRPVWGRRHHGRRVPGEEWVWSPVWAHPPIVSAAEFVAANRRTRWATALPVTEDPVTGWTDRRAA